MLQSAVCTQLARVKHFPKVTKFFYCAGSLDGQSKQFSTYCPGPMAVYAKKAAETVSVLGPDEKHWFGGGIRSASVGIHHLKNNEVIAVPTDTVYGFAALAQSNEAIDRLYEIKGRERTKPLAITLGNVTDVSHWAHIDHIPSRLLNELLPGAVTLVLKRKSSLNRALNSGHGTVGVRVPRSNFIRQICQMLGQPLALTSANVSNEPSSVHPNEFAPLWPKLGAIFYDIKDHKKLDDSQRVGSTVIDLTVPGEFEILRCGVRFPKVLEILKNFGVRRYSVANSDNSDKSQRDCVVKVNS